MVPCLDDAGGSNPAFLRVAPDAQWDSWLTIGLVDGDVHDDLGSLGIDWSDWSADRGLSVDNGAVFWLVSPPAALLLVVVAAVLAGSLCRGCQSPPVPTMLAA